MNVVFRIQSGVSKIFGISVLALSRLLANNVYYCYWIQCICNICHTWYPFVEKKKMQIGIRSHARSPNYCCSTFATPTFGTYLVKTCDFRNQNKPFCNHCKTYSFRNLKKYVDKHSLLIKRGYARLWIRLSVSHGVRQKNIMQRNT